MPYKVHRGKLLFEPRVGNGPCARRNTGDDFRRHIRMQGQPEGVTTHATKGRVHDGRSRLGGENLPLMPPSKEPRQLNVERIQRNDAGRWAAVRVEAPEVMTRQRRRRMLRSAAS
jgi:hypothetical protein